MSHCTEETNESVKIEIKGVEIPEEVALKAMLAALVAVAEVAWGMEGLEAGTCLSLLVQTLAEEFLHFLG